MDPRSLDFRLPTSIPFLLLPKQEERTSRIMDRRKGSENESTERSQEMGLSWTSIGLACSLRLFNKETAIRPGSRKEGYANSTSSPEAPFWKTRKFAEVPPAEFRGSWNYKKHTPHI